MRVKGKFIAANLVFIGWLLWIYVAFKLPALQFPSTSKHWSNDHESSSSPASAHKPKIVEAKLEGPLEINFENSGSESSTLAIPPVVSFSSTPLPTHMPSAAVDYTDPFDVKSRLFYGNVYFQSSKYQVHSEQMFRSELLQMKTFKYRFTATSQTSHSVPPVT